MGDPVKIDGGYLEGGGQILRTSLSLSVLLQKEFEISNIRAKRRNPGLQPQHLTAVKAMQKISAAGVAGAELHSTHLRFSPGEISGGKYVFDVSEVKESAGAVSLIFQALLPPLIFAGGPSEIILKGGTHVSWSPCFEYLDGIFLPAVAKMGANAQLRLNKYGWYPVGKGEMEAKIGGGPGGMELKSRGKLHGIGISNRGKLMGIHGVSIVSNLPGSIAERQKAEALEKLGPNYETKIKIPDAPSVGKGTMLFLKADFEMAPAGFFSLGEIGKSAEKVADGAVEALLSFMDNPHATVDAHLADQLLVYAALAEGNTRYCAERVTAHLEANAYTIKQFIPDVKIAIDQQTGWVEVEGIGFGRRAGAI